MTRLPVLQFPPDITAVLLIVVATNAAIFSFEEPFVRIPLGILFVLFVPGYVFVAALFPETRVTPSDGTAAKGGETEPNGDSATARPWSQTGQIGIDGAERIALSFGLSVAIVPLIGVALHFSPWGIRPVPVIMVLNGIIVMLTAVATVRRFSLPKNERFQLRYRRWFHTARRTLFDVETRVQAVVSVLLVLSVVVALGAGAFALSTSPAEEPFSAIYLLTEEDGELTATNYPTELEIGEATEIVVGIENHEQRPVDYTVVVLEQRVEGEHVLEERERDRISLPLDDDETWRSTAVVEPTMAGQEIRFVWLLFSDTEVPDDPSADDTPYVVRLSITVAPPD